MSNRAEHAASLEGFTSSREHILAELDRIDLLIQVQVWRARQVLATDDQFQGLVIMEDEVDVLIAEPAGLPHWARAQVPLAMMEVREAVDDLARHIARRKSMISEQGCSLRLDELARLFDLTPFDKDALLVCLAPEIDLRYERLYAYLQDDVTKKRPSVDLVLNLLSPSFEAKLAWRQRFTATAPLLQHHLLHLFQDPGHVQPPLLGHYLKVDERVVDFLLEADEIDGRLLPYTCYSRPQTRLEDIMLPDDLRRRLVLLTRNKGKTGRGLIFYFQGPYGVGKHCTAQALCRELDIGLLTVDGERLVESQEIPFDEAVDLITREALLQNTALYWDGIDSLLVDDPAEAAQRVSRKAWRDTLLGALEKRRELTFLGGNVTWEPQDTLQEKPFVRVEFERPGHGERLRLWQMSLDGSAPREGDLDLDALAGKFRFSGGQIQDAAVTARNLACWRDPEEGQVTMEDLYAASRLQSNRSLARLAQKITPHYTWNDIVLPADRLQQLREICNSVVYRAQVYEAWGFDSKLAMGKGLNTLFSGPSGTGKTMAADILAHDLGLDLYKIDLSTVVSKYIGETEKNLARIFAEAETSNAILFFDEADALFGKRSEVRDAHDRYANIEISYLLQKMEEYEGVVILATNLRKNMDDAFVRRMHFTVEFPFPTDVYRRQIWSKIWPGETPLSSDLDLDFIARQFELAGGNIRNIALAAAFLAASDGRAVDMGHLLQATQREYQKMGKVIMGDTFEQHTGV